MLFARLQAIYGARFDRLWAQADAEEVKRVWNDQLRRFDAEQVGRAVELCATEVESPPNLPEFVKLVRSCYRAGPGAAALPAREVPLLTGRDDLELQIVREYPREERPPFRYWAKRIMRLRQLGRAVPFRSVEMAKEVLHIGDAAEFAERYPPEAA